jgi:hypothetical protein
MYVIYYIHLLATLGSYSCDLLIGVCVVYRTASDIQHYNEVFSTTMVRMCNSNPTCPGATSTCTTRYSKSDCSPRRETFFLGAGMDGTQNATGATPAALSV